MTPRKITHGKGLRLFVLVLLMISPAGQFFVMARPTAYGAVPGYRPVAFGNGKQ